MSLLSLPKIAVIHEIPEIDSCVQVFDNGMTFLNELVIGQATAEINWAQIIASRAQKMRSMMLTTPHPFYRTIPAGSLIPDTYSLGYSSPKGTLNIVYNRIGQSPNATDKSYEEFACLLNNKHIRHWVVRNDCANLVFLIETVQILTALANIQPF